MLIYQSDNLAFDNVVILFDNIVDDNVVIGGVFMKRNFSKLVFGICCFLSLSACGKGAPVGYEGYGIKPGKNQEKVMRMIGDWTKTGIGTHYHSGPDAGPLVMFGIEGLCQYVRTTDKIYMLLAESIETDPENNTVSIVKLRDNAYWTDGEPVISKDFMTYWYLAHNDTTSYMVDVQEVNDKTFKIFWKPYCCPSEEARKILLSQDKKCGCAPYHIFKQFADEAISLTKALKEDDPEDVYYYQAHFGKKWTEEANRQYGEIYTNFRAFKVNGIYPGTGPYILDSYDENTMILKKNQNYYNKDGVSFEKMIFKRNSDSSNNWQMFLSNEIYYLDGLPLKAQLESYLKQNPAMVNYKVYTQDTLGILFNFQKSIWNNKKVREAFQYILDRDLIRQSVAWYTTTCWTPLTAMADYEAEKWLNPDDFAKIPHFSFDQSKASQLLNEAGWQKKNGAWYDERNVKVSLTLGTPGWNDLSNILQSLFGAFGISITIKIADSPTALLANARVADSEYDFMTYFTSLNPWGNHPGGAYKHFFDQMDAAMMCLPTDPNTGRYKLTCQKADGTGTFDAWSVYERIYTYTGDTLRSKTGDLVVGIANEYLGIDLYNGLTGSNFNLDYVGNLPLQEKFAENRNVTDVLGYDDYGFDELAATNVYFGEHTSYSHGLIVARD